ncbi:RebB family R body protein [Chromobacterium sp. CV08]|uniref:RebB family R body protein n=1 Tax=Chromobacterium sp. CV08 TaxID=3133274 RepID=UPI003DA9097B
MAFPTAVNNQITDAVTQSNVKVLGEAPAMAIGSIYQTMAHSTGILFENAVSAQQQQNALAQAASNQGVTQFYGAAEADAPTAGILAKRDPAELEALIRQLKSE